MTKEHDILPQAVVILRDAETIKSYVHPVRMTILKKLAAKKRTVSSIAREIGVHPANITHHFKLLEKTGLLVLVEQKDTGKNIEKFYRAIAYDFLVKTDDEKLNKKSLSLSILKNNLESAIIKTNQDETEEILALLRTVMLSSDDFQRLKKKLEKMVKEMKNNKSKTAKSYSINISIYPDDGLPGLDKEVTIK
jgi:DNA-binding transcriptional ArsR family regulator